MLSIKTLALLYNIIKGSIIKNIYFL